MFDLTSFLGLRDCDKLYHSFLIFGPLLGGHRIYKSVPLIFFVSLDLSDQPDKLETDNGEPCVKKEAQAYSFIVFVLSSIIFFFIHVTIMFEGNSYDVFSSSFLLTQ